MKQFHHIETVHTRAPISIVNLNDEIYNAIGHSEIKNGFVTVSSRHTTTAIGINEYEERLLVDIAAWLETLAPKDKHYLHNDIELRDCPEDEPKNAHSHLMALLIGSSQTVPLVNGKLQIGQYQSVLLFDLDGPRERTVNISIIGMEGMSWR